MSASNRKELTLMDRAGIHLLSRAIRHLGISRAPEPLNVLMSELLADRDAQEIMSSCAAAVFHGGEPRKAQKKAGAVA